MTPSQYQRLVPLFEAAMRLRPWQRGTFAKDQCGNDPQLLKDLLVLLQNAEKSADSFDRPIGRVHANASRSQNRQMSGDKGLVVEGYQIIRSLGRGGMGKVFEAIDRKTGETVAIKFIQTRGAFSEERRLRFLLEARGMASMHHSNIVELYDIGQSQGHLYLVMEYLKGRSLRDWLSRGQLQQHFSDVLRILGQTARALAFAHAGGFVHGDVKPDNIMVLEDGSAKLIDFGLAQQEALNGSLAAGGTPAYMAPELFAPQAAATAASDIWALGITLLECLNGKLPFANSGKPRSSVADYRLPEDTPFVADLNSLIDQLLRKNLAERRCSAEALAQELERLEAGHSINSAEEARNASDKVQRQAYSPPDLGLSSQVKAPIESGMRKFSWLHKQWPVSWRLVILTAVAAVYGFLFVMLGLQIDSPSVFWAGLCSLICCCWLWSWPLARFFVCRAYEKRQFCGSCEHAMRKTSTWTRFAMERTEVVYGRGDCVAALKHGLWQEAAKMVSIHGKDSRPAEDNILICPARFRLEFFECDVCRDQAARLIAEEVEGDMFRPRPEYFEAYRRVLGPAGSLSSSQTRPYGAAAFFGRFWAMLLLRRRISGIRSAISSIGVGSRLFVAVCLIAVLDLAWIYQL